MIVDTLDNALLYFGLGEGIKKGLLYLAGTDFSKLETGRHDIEGDQLFAIVQEYQTKPLEKGKWEAHRRYWDIQYVVKGTEQIHYANIEHLSAGEYDAEKDFLGLEGKGDQVTLREGMFAILSPQDAHMPGMAQGQSVAVSKVVVKVAYE
ncbi:MAG: YhcH/YjgK/YiaL family protein [Bacteroidota bacterium]